MEKEQQSTPRDFEEFKKNIRAMIGTNSTAHRRNPSRRDPVYDNYTMDDIHEIIIAGDPVEMRELSRLFYRFSGIYRRTISFYSHLLLYDFVMTPKISGTIAKNKVMTRYRDALNFLDGMDIRMNFGRVSELILKQGVYFGLLRSFKDSSVFQDLPLQFCRSRYKNEFGIDILEFDVRYFEKVPMESRKELLDSFPAEIVKHYVQYKNSSSKVDPWMRVPDQLGIVFYFNDFTPYFISAIPSIMRAESAQEREESKDSEELQKILINRMPINTKQNQPVFTLQQTAVIHKGLADMLSDNSFIDVLTTFGDTTLEKAQDNSGEAQKDSINKFGNASYAELGVSGVLFNAEGNTALKYSVDKDTSLMYSFSIVYSNWLTYHVNRLFGNDKIYFDVEFLPTTIHNRKEMMDTYLKGAQFGYSKFYAGVAQGIKQSNLMDIVSFENDYLQLVDKMIPLQSSYTQDGESEGKGNAKHTGNGPGRPELSDGDKSDKTIANRDAM